MASIVVKGMMCKHCLGAVTKAMEAVENAGNVTVDLATGIAQWTGSATAESMIQAVTAQGYQAEKK
jgi:copper chaperone